MKKALLALLSAGMMFSGISAVNASEKGESGNKEQVTITSKKADIKKAAARLRGRLLYKKNQARKMERAVEAAHPDTREKIGELRRQIADLYIAGNPKIADNYAEQRDLEAQIAELKK